MSLLVTYDPSRIADDVPPNVERYINIFQSSNIMGGGNVVQGSRFHGHYASYNLKDHTEIIHINIEKADRIQEQLVTKIAQLAAIAGRPPKARRCRCIWKFRPTPRSNCGTPALPVAAHAGDTLKTFAATYHVPVWALAQINSVSDREQLAEGQRVVVPRYLAPMSGTQHRDQLRARRPLNSAHARSAMRREAEPARLEAAPERHRRRLAADAGIDLAPVELIAIGDAAPGRLRAGACHLFVLRCKCRIRNANASRRPARR